MEPKVTVTVSGPVFDGRALAATAAFLAEWAEQTAQEAWETVQREMAGVFAHPTGAYASRVVTERATANRWLVHDSNMVYGPWLEGVSSRNAATRFKGYRHWRATTQQADAEAAAIGRNALPPFLGRMNR